MRKKLLISVWAVVLVGTLAFESAAQTIGQPSVTAISGEISVAGYCSGGQIRVTFTTAMFAAGTSFNVQLSSSMGVFPVTPNVIGSGTASPITATLPTTAASGIGYQVRVASVTTPAVTSTSSTVFQVTNTAPPTAVARSYCQMRQQHLLRLLVRT
jgi:hypothetical protein